MSHIILSVQPGYLVQPLELVRGIDGVWTEFFVLSEKFVKICDSGLF